MKSGELRICNSTRRCFFFTIRLDGTVVGSARPVQQSFYIVTPVKEATKEEAYLYLCHALLVSKCYTNAQRLHRVFAAEFEPSISVEDFTRKHKDVFDIWELRRQVKGQQILYTNEHTAKEAMTDTCSSEDIPQQAQDIGEVCDAEILMSNMSSVQGSLAKKQAPLHVREEEGPPLTSKESYRKLKEELEEYKNLLRNEKKAKSKEDQELRETVSSLQKRLQEVGSKSAEQYNSILVENEKAVAGIESAFKKREAELHETYQKALQDRDVRIAQLSDVQIKLQTQNYHNTGRMQQLEHTLEQERASRGLYRSEASSDLSSVLHGKLLETEQKCLLLERDCREKVEYQAKLETELRSAKIQIISQQSELERASMLLTALKDGLQLVKQSIPQLS